jgi:hypothetical protein
MMRANGWGDDLAGTQTSELRSGVPNEKAPLESAGRVSTCVVADDRLSCQGQKLLGAIPERDTIPAAATTDWVRPFRLLSH